MTFLFRDVSGPRLGTRGSVICIGAFDGVHLGHQGLLSRVRQRADALGVDAVAISFEPLPREFFQRGGPLARLSSARQKFELLRDAGMHHVGLLRFNQALAETSAEGFVQHLLVDRLQAREIWIGPDFRFGHDRKGDLALLQQLGALHGFSAQAIAGAEHAEARISSSRIRSALQNADLGMAKTMLGRDYSISGRVVHGLKLGRTLGYPTANLPLGKRLPPVHGIYAVRVSGAGLQHWPSVASLGTRPTIAGRELLLEAHLFDFNGDLYGQRLDIAFVGKLRNEVKFDNLDALVVQMNIDSEQARALLLRATKVLDGNSGDGIMGDGSA
jgi:riboflavin kinase / FMN adenylyltransferase